MSRNGVSTPPVVPIVVADEAISCLDELFGARTEIVRRPGAAIRREHLAGARGLLVRSVTRVDASLLSGTSIEWVGSVTAGTDHVDVAWLDAHGIAFAHAPGANAEAVAQYVVAALLHLSIERGLDLARSTIGVIGRGHVGRRVLVHARRLGMRVLASDPPLERAGDPGPFVPLEDLLAWSNVVTLHVPLVRGGPDPTVDLLDGARLAAMRSGAFLVNSCRGGVVDEVALTRVLDSGRLGGAVLDVFAGEPSVDEALVRRADLATPHIAGYTVEAKTAVTLAVYRAFAPRFGWPDRAFGELLERPVTGLVRLPPPDATAALAATGLPAVSAELRANPREFARIRKDYVFRREIFEPAG